MHRKNVPNKIMSVLILGFVVFLSGCFLPKSESQEQESHQANAANQSATVLERMAEIYSTVEDKMADNDFSTAMAGVLAGSGVTYAPAVLTNDTLRKKIELINLFKQAVKQYSLYGDENYASKSEDFTLAAQSANNCMKEINDTASVTYTRDLTKYLQASRYEVSKVMYTMIQALNAIWKSDVAKWNSALNSSFADFQRELAAVDENAFSEEKLQKYVYQPYNGKQSLVAAYKMNLVKERYDGLRTFIRKEDNISSALYYLECAYSEFNKKNVDMDLINNYLERIDVILQEKASETSN